MTPLATDTLFTGTTLKGAWVWLARLAWVLLLVTNKES